MSAALDPRLTPARPDLAAAALRGIVQAPRYVEGVRRAVRDPAVPLRKAPRPDLAFETELLHGEVFVVYDSDAEGWSWGQGERDGYVGWLPTDALAPEAPAPTHTVVALRSFVFPSASIKQPPLAVLPFGARVVGGRRDGAFLGTPSGWLWSGHLAPVDQAMADPVAVAELFLHAPYLWGGRTSLGLDCSALVQTALHACGRLAPRDSDMQERELGEAIDCDGPLRRGDLVFWRGHVGLMQDATTLLHANGHSMTVAREDLAAARSRILHAGGGPVTSARRLG